MDVFLQFAIVLGFSVLLAVVARYFKQPLIIGYIVSGLLIGTWLSHGVVDLHSLESFAQIGVALLLFIVGLGLNPEIMRAIGRVAILTGLGQILFTSVIGYGLGLLLGFSTVSALYLAVAFTFSSTVIIMSLLHERGDEESLYGRISIGFLLVQDLVALVVLIAASLVGRFESGTGVDAAISLLVFNFAALLLLAYLAVRFLIPKVDKIFARHSQLLTLFALTLCFGTAALFDWVGFSMELGALVAGILLASSPYQREIAARVRPLRDFFLVIFFVALGLSMQPGAIGTLWFPAIIFSLFILIGNPLIVILLMRLLNYSAKTGFYAGLTVAQISEFSLVLLAMGVTLGHLPENILGLGTLVGLITIAGSSYMIAYADRLFYFLKPFLKKIGSIRSRQSDNHAEEYEVIIFGCHRLGGGIVSYLKKQRVSFLIIDNDPSAVSDLKKRRLSAEFGEIDDWQFLEELPLKQAKMIISTVPEVDANSVLLKYLKSIRSQASVVVRAHYNHHAKDLYAKGATFVVVPPYLGRQYLVELVKDHGLDKRKYQAERTKHLKDISQGSVNFNG